MYYLVSSCMSRDLGTSYLKSYYCHWPNLNKLDSLLSSNSKNNICADLWANQKRILISNSLI